jgi:hypothetical protein
MKLSGQKWSMSGAQRIAKPSEPVKKEISGIPCSNISKTPLDAICHTP